ncbi:MAG: hypothetical protein OHK0046_28830 [Anaerolineae bacterium]
MMECNPLTPCIENAHLFLSDEAIKVLIKAGIEQRVFATARYGFMLDCENPTEVRNAFASMLTAITSHTAAYND